MKFLYVGVCIASSAATLFVLLVVLAPRDDSQRASFEEFRASVSAGHVTQIDIDDRSYVYREVHQHGSKRADGPVADLPLVMSLHPDDATMTRARVRFVR